MERHATAITTTSSDNNTNRSNSSFVHAAATATRLPPLESVSPGGGFVSVFTPVDKRSSSDPERDEVDANGIRLHAWSAPELADADCRSAYFWSVALCPCVAVAQLETRMGLTTYARALATTGVTYAAFAATFVGVIVTFVRLFDADTRSVCALAGFVCAFAAFAGLVALRVARLRSLVRARFRIAGSDRNDGYVGCLHTTRAIRQMGRHLQCDRAVFCAAPATLQAYEV